MSTYERRLSWLRTFRGYSEDEAELAAWAADEIERLQAALEATERDYARLLVEVKALRTVRG